MRTKNKSRSFAALRMTPLLLALSCGAGAWAQGVDASQGNDAASVAVGRGAAVQENFPLLPHPYHVVARHPKPGCTDTARCGQIFYDYWGHNLRTQAGTDWQAEVMCITSGQPPACNYIALTDTAITPSISDTSLAGEITSNGLARAQAAYTDTSAGLPTPLAPTLTVDGTAGSTTYYYWLSACNSQGCTPLSGSASTASANSTLSATNYVQVSFPAVTAATSYKVWRTTSNTAPSGTVSELVANAAFCNGTTCYVYDQSNTLGSGTVPSSNQTYAGSLTLVYTWTATAAQAAQAFGVFNASSAGTLCFEGTFAQVSLNASDTLQVTETIYY